MSKQLERLPLYEPVFENTHFEGSKVVNGLEVFREQSNVLLKIVRMMELRVLERVYP